MSGGECQRTAVVRALINKPKLLLADEPTGALDVKNATILSELLSGLSRDEGVTLVTVTHAPDLAARMDEVFSLSEGKITRAE
jgi:ABC-type lipoprotein export system ATPase subunit